MDYTRMDYIRVYIWTAIGLLLLMLLAITVGRYLQRRWKRYYVTIIPMIIWVGVFLLVSFGWIIKSVEYTDCLFIGGPQDTYEYAGTVTAVQASETLPTFYAQGKMRTGAVAEIGDRTFYVLADGKLQPGMLVAVTYVPEDNLILHWHTVTAEEAETIAAAALPEPMAEEVVQPSSVETPQTKQQIVGNIISWISIAGFMLLIFYTTINPLHFTTWLQEKDACGEQGVRPNWGGFLLTMSPGMLMCIAVMGAMLVENTIGEMIAFLLFAITFFTVLYFYQTKRIAIEGRYMILRRFGKEKTIPLDRIRKVEWIAGGRQHKQRRLWIQIYGESDLILSQAFHCGLFDLYRRLSAYTEQTPQ